MNDIKIHYLDIGDKDAMPLIFIHGLSCDSTFWQKQIDKFANNYRVIAIDLPGFGKSDKPQDVPYTQGLFAKAVKTVMDAAKIRRPVLIGHSMGFSVARQFLIDYPGEARALVSVDGALLRIPADTGKLMEWEQQMKGFASIFEEPNRQEKVNAFIEMTFTDKTSEDVRQAVRNVMSMANAYASASSVTEFIKPAQLANKTFDIPALLIYAENPMEEPDLPEFLKIIFPRSQFIKWDDVGHFIMMEQPERFNKVLNDFLTNLQ